MRGCRTGWLSFADEVLGPLGTAPGVTPERDDRDRGDDAGRIRRREGRNCLRERGHAEIRAERFRGRLTWIAGLPARARPTGSTTFLPGAPRREAQQDRPDCCAAGVLPRPSVGGRSTLGSPLSVIGLVRPSQGRRLGPVATTRPPAQAATLALGAGASAGSLSRRASVSSDSSRPIGVRPIEKSESSAALARPAKGAHGSCKSTTRATASQGSRLGRAALRPVTCSIAMGTRSG